MNQESSNSATKAWIVVGAFWVALLVYCMIWWVLGPDFKPNTFGRDQAPHDYVVFIKTLEAAMVVLTLWMVWRSVLRPYLRDRQLSFDGLFFLAGFTLLLQEPWHCWIRPQLLYNTIFFNMGSWMGALPVSNPTANITPLPLAFAGLGYIWIYGGPAYLGAKLMARAKARNPRLSNFRLIACTMLGFCVFDVIIETFIVRTGLFIYPSTIPALTLFAGNSYQFPILETPAWAGCYTVAACLYHFRNARGETVADRNLDSVVKPGAKRTFARWLAIVGFLQIGMLVNYNLPYFIYGLHGGPFTVTEQSHPWLTAGLCGPSTPYDCPGPGVPFARRESTTNRTAPATDLTNAR